MLTPPYDTTDPSEPRVRDDLTGVKVWISTTAGFTPDPASAIDFAANSSIILTDLQMNTRYYVRYAFISKIEPSIYTISAQLTAKTYDELTTVYGELTNDPVYLSREAATSNLDWAPATGTFRVWEYNTEVTGNGVQYGVVSGSATNGLIATINATTGQFSATGWTSGTKNAKITFYAIYNNITVTRDWNIVDGIGQDAPQITLTTSPDVFIYKNDTAILADTAKIKATANLVNLVGNPTFTVRAYRRDGTLISTPTVQFTVVPGDPKSIEITNQQFHISSDIGYITIEARVGDIYDLDTVFRLNNGTNEITVDVDNPVVQLQSTELGQIDPAEYNESGTKITVYEGATKLAVSTSGGAPSTWAAGSWSVTTIQGFGIVPDDDWTVQNNSIVFGSHSTMTTDTAYIEYTITYKTTAGFVDTRIVKQNFAKSKQGFPGISAPIVTIKGAQAFVRPANEPISATAPNYIDLLAATSNITNPQFQWRVDGVVQAGETESDFRVNKFTNTEFKTIRVDVTGLNSQGESITQFDEHTVYFVDSGDSAIIAFCTPEFTGISCDSEGIPEPTQFPFYINTTVLRGGTVLNNSTPGTIQYALQDLVGILPADISINQTTGIVTVADINATYCSFNVKFTIGTTEIIKSVRLNKILEGNSAPVVNLTSTSQVFVKNKNTGILAPSNITITATAINVPNTEYTWTIDGVAQPQFDDDASIQISAFEGSPKLVNCTVTSSSIPSISVFDALTLYSVKEGDDALVFGITNENQTLTCDNAGVPVAGQFPITSNLVTLRGTEILTPPTVTYSITSQTGTDATKVTLTNGVLSIASGGITADFAEISLRATIGTTQLNKSLTISKSKEGAKGSDAINIDLISDSDVVTTLNDGTGYTLPTGNSVRLYKGGAALVTGVTYSGTATQNGLTLTVNASTGALTLSGTSWTSNQENFTITANYTGISYTVVYSIAKSKQGSDAINIDLISDSDVVTTLNDGTGYTLPTGNSVRLYKGGVVLTSGVTYSGTATQNGLTLTVNSATGALTLSGTSWVSNQENFIVTASYAGTSYTITYSIAKSRQGVKGDNAKTVDITGITNFKVNTAGTYSPTSAALTAVTQNITAPTYSWTITGATPATSTASSVTITPAANVQSITAQLTVTEPSTSQTFTKTVTLSVAYDGSAGAAAKGIDISGATNVSFKLVGGVYTPTPPVTLTATPQNLTSPTYSWTISGGSFSGSSTVTTSTASSVTVYPTSSTSVTVNLIATDSGTQYSKSVVFSVVSDGIGQDGKRTSTGYVYYYQSSATAPTGLSTTGVTYTFATGVFSGGVFAGGTWSTQAPQFVASNGNKYWAATYTVVENTAGGGTGTGSNISFGTVSQTIGFTGLVTFTSANAVTDGTNGLSFGATGQTQIDGGRITTGLVVADRIDSRGLSIKDANGNIILAAGTALDWSSISTSYPNSLNNAAIVIDAVTGALNGIGTGTGTAVRNSNISINNAGTLSGAGGGTVTIGGLGYSGDLDAQRNNRISINATNGTLDGIGTGTGTAVRNSNITVSNNGTLNNAGGGTVTIGGLGYSGDLDAQRNNRITISGGNISGIGTGDGTTVANSSITINSTNGTLDGIGTGTGTAVRNSNISINNAGTLSGAGGGTVTIGGLGYSGDLDAQRNSRISIDSTNGTLDGIGTGTGTAVRNSNISINNAGTLSGAGGGTVTIGGLGYSGDLDAQRNSRININASTGTLDGIGTGTGTAVRNTNITMSSSGTINNAGGGTVTISGLGYTGDLAANNTFVDTSGNIQGVSQNAGTAVRNSNISISSTGTLSGAGGGTVSLSGLGAGNFATLNQITQFNISTYIASAAIGAAYIGELGAANIAAGAITAGKIQVNNLQAVSATIGTLRTATSGARVEISDNIIRVYDSSNTLRVRIGVF
jgi:hypothetical protein